MVLVPLFGQLRRAICFGGVTLALASAATPGCLLPDYCISIGITGSQVCLALPGTAGVTDQGDVVEIRDGAGAIQGCDCLFGFEVDILEQSDMESAEYVALFSRLENAARQRCLDLAAEGGLDQNNCMEIAIDESLLLVSPDSCEAGCVYANPPPAGECRGECFPPGTFGDEMGAEESGTGDDDPPAQILNRGPGAP